MDLFEKGKEILATKTFSQSALTIFATILSGVLGLFFYLTLAKELGTAAFGIFSVGVATLSLLADVGDLGTDTGLIRFIGKYINEKDKVAKFLKLGLEINLAVWIVVLVIGWFLTPLIAERILLKPELLTPLRLALFGFGGALLFSFSNHALQAFQKYTVWSLAQVFGNLVRFLVVLLIIFTIGLNLYNSLYIYILVPFVFFLLSLLFLPKFFKVKNELSVSKEFFNFNIWVFIITIISALAARTDTFLITRFLPINQVGIYAAAMQLTSFMPQLAFAIATVAAPKLAGFTTKAMTIKYLKKLQLFCTGIALVGLTGIPVAYLLINKFYGQSYLQSFLPFVILYLGQLLLLMALPAQQAIFYYFAKPKFFVPLSVLHLAIILILGTIFINSLGIVGAAWAVLISEIMLVIMPVSWVVYQFTKNE